MGGSLKGMGPSARKLSIVVRPRMARQTELPHRGPLKPRQQHFMGLNILLVDDSGVMRKLVSKALRQAGLDISGTVEASNGQEGLDALGAGKVDVVLCDWNMPVMDGLTFVKEARPNHKVPIIMLTTESGDDKMAAALEAGADGYITKPFTPEKLGERIQFVTEQRKSA